MKKPPPPELLAQEALHGAKLMQALTRLLHDSPASGLVKLGTLTFACGRALAVMVRDGGADLEEVFDLVVRNLRRAAVGEFGRRPTLH